MTVNESMLLPLTIHGTPSGNYDGSSLAFDSDPVRAANYYGGQGSIQTATIRTEGFQGNVSIQATLNDQPSIQAAWFEVDSLSNPSPASAIDGRTVVGSFTFMRAQVTDFEAGSISITLTF